MSGLGGAEEEDISDAVQGLCCKILVTGDRQETRRIIEASVTLKAGK